jgi:hypothetical protein
VGRKKLSCKILILHKDCDPDLAQDRTLPYTAYLVEYISEESTHWDIVVTGKQLDIFDYYWDTYREGLIGWKQTEGRVNPKLWNNPANKKKK